MLTSPALVDEAELFFTKHGVAHVSTARMALTLDANIIALAWSLAPEEQPQEPTKKA